MFMVQHYKKAACLIVCILHKEKKNQIDYIKLFQQPLINHVTKN